MKKIIIGLTILASAIGITTPVFASDVVNDVPKELQIEKALENKKLPEIDKSKSINYDNLLDENAPWNSSTYATSASFSFKDSTVGSWNSGVNWYVAGPRNMRYGVVQWGTKKADGQYNIAKVAYKTEFTNTSNVYLEKTFTGNMNPGYSEYARIQGGSYKTRVKPITALSSGNGHVYTS